MWWILFLDGLVCSSWICRSFQSWILPLFNSYVCFFVLTSMMAMIEGAISALLTLVVQIICFQCISVCVSNTKVASFLPAVDVYLQHYSYVLQHYLHDSINEFVQYLHFVQRIQDYLQCPMVWQFPPQLPPVGAYHRGSCLICFTIWGLLPCLVCLFLLF